VVKLTNPLIVPELLGGVGWGGEGRGRGGVFITSLNE